MFLQLHYKHLTIFVDMDSTYSGNRLYGKESGYKSLFTSCCWFFLYLVDNMVFLLSPLISFIASIYQSRNFHIRNFYLEFLYLLPTRKVIHTKRTEKKRCAIFNSCKKS